jgi:phosphoglycolate phosphatase
MSTPALVIFDLDGTLVDSAPDIARAVAITLREAGVDPPPLADVKAMVGDGARVLLERAVAAAGAQRDLDALLARFLVHYDEGLCIESRLYEGVPELLAQLQTSGVSAAVLTNKPGDLARRLLATLGIAHSFSAIVGDGDGFPRKPDPTAARALLEKAAVGAERAVVVGDGLPDVQVARALGARSLAVAWGYVPPDRLRAAGASEVVSTARDLFQALLNP